MHESPNHSNPVKRGDERVEYKKLLDRSDNWLKYAILLHLFHEPKDTLGEIRKTALADVRIQNFLAGISDYHGSLVTNHKKPDLPIHKLFNSI